MLGNRLQTNYTEVINPVNPKTKLFTNVKTRGFIIMMLKMKKYVGRPLSGWENNIQMDLTETGWAWIGLI
jgi:hypothetical protein